jgi:hypothetical protein
VTAAEERRLASRVDEMVMSVNQLETTVKAHLAKCEVCHPIVFGNGRPSVDTRVTALETTERMHGGQSRKQVVYMAAGIGAVAGIAGSLGGAILRWALG